MSTTAKKFDAKSIVLVGMFCAVAYVVMLLSKLIPINVAGFLNFDLKDVIIAICGLISGPLPALIVSVIVSFFEMITVSATGPIGLLMNVLATCARRLCMHWLRPESKYGTAKVIDDLN